MTPGGMVLFVAGAALLFVACGGDDGGASPTAGRPQATLAVVALTERPATTPATASVAPSPTATAVPATALPSATPLAATPTATAPAAVQQAPTATPPPPPPPTLTPAPTRSGPVAVTVLLEDNRFNPRTVTIPAGSTVTWTRVGKQFHDVSSESFPSDPAGPQTSGSYTFTFPAAGTYEYRCGVHPLEMQGTVIVQ